VKGSVIITHGRAKRRMIGFGCAVAAETARTGVPALIAEALREDAARLDAAGVGAERSAEEATLDPEDAP
jgi:fatty acid/phospholipid biosynthesis enzyme